MIEYRQLCHLPVPPPPPEEVQTEEASYVSADDPMSEPATDYVSAEESLEQEEQEDALSATMRKQPGFSITNRKLEPTEKQGAFERIQFA